MKNEVVTGKTLFLCVKAFVFLTIYYIPKANKVYLKESKSMALPLYILVVLTLQTLKKTKTIYVGTPLFETWKV